MVSCAAHEGISGNVGPIVGTPTGFHTHEGRRQRRDNGQPLTAGHTLPGYPMSAIIPPDDVQHQLRDDVEAEHAYGLCRGTRLLSGNGSPR
jgi:hypothetical protein